MAPKKKRPSRSSKRKRTTKASSPTRPSAPGRKELKRTVSSPSPPPQEEPQTKKRKTNLSQTAAKRSFTREKLSELLQKVKVEKEKERKEVDLDLMKLYSEKLGQYRDDLTKYDEIIQDGLSGQSLVEEVSESGGILDDLRTTMLEVSSFIDKCERSDGGAAGGGHGSTSGRLTGNSAKLMPRLLKIEIDTFHGDPIRWQSFWDRYSSAIHTNEWITDVDKFVYLQKYMGGEAKRAIDGIALTSANYPMAIEILKERFGDQQTVVGAHFDKMWKLTVKSNKTTDLRLFCDETEKHIRCLEASGVQENEFAKTFVSIILMKLPSEVKLELRRRKGDSNWDLQTLRKALKDEIAARESCPNEFEDSKKVTKYETPRRFISTSSALTVNSKSPFHKHHPYSNTRNTSTNNHHSKRCSYCGEMDSHFTDECHKYPDLQSRKQCLGKRCYLCLRKDHQMGNCTANNSCFYCRGRHHRSLCPKQFGTQSSTVTSKLVKEKSETAPTLMVTATSDSRTVALLSSTQRTILPTARTEILSAYKRNSPRHRCRLVIDTGSHRSFITQDLADKLKIKPIGSEMLEVGTFASDTADLSELQIANVKLRTKLGVILDLTVNIVSRISIPIHKEGIDTRKYPILQKVTLSEPVSRNAEAISLDLLIGSDYAHDVLLTGKIQLDKGLYLLKSVFGWILSGRVTPAIDTSSIINPSTALLIPSKDFQMVIPELSEFWELEGIGVKDPGHLKDDDIAMKKFENSVNFQDGRYMVSWPWKDPIPELPENFELSLGRLRSLQKRLTNQPEIQKSYSEIIEQQLTDGIIERVVPGMAGSPHKHYLPHHGVVRSDAVSSKLRIVYDASAKVDGKSNSLNDCLYRGPVLLQDLCTLLLRFRIYPIAILSDIEKAFLQIGLHIEDRDVTRFLWFNSENCLEIYRFKRVPFGVISSPFLLGATVNHHLRMDGSAVAKKIGDNIYVDNVCVGADTADEAKGIYTSAKAILQRASMNLREWASNSQEFIDSVPSYDRLNDVVIKVLGLSWNTHSDLLSIRKTKLFHEETMSKRIMLSAIAGFFDPLGLFSPVLIRAKLIIQNLWKMNLDWDASVPGEVLTEWNELMNDLYGITDLQVPRFVGITNSIYHTDVKFELHCFCDSSASAFAACVYLKVSQGDKAVSHLLFSKNRLAPVKTLTIPRLELMAVVIGVRILTFVEQSLKITAHQKILWSDSQCVLSWISSNKMKSVFVENRLSEIRSHSNVEFRYISTNENPADLPTRGLSVSELRNSHLWWFGPSWLANPPENWPQQKVTPNSTFETMENRKGVDIVLASVSTPPFLANLLTKVSSLDKLIRITALLFRAKAKFRRLPSKIGPLTADELSSAQLFWDHTIQSAYYSEERSLILKGKSNSLIQQLNLFIDDTTGLIRCKGRIGNAILPESAKFPILMPKNSPYVSLLIRQVHWKLQHAGANHVLAELRYRYWVPAVRQLIQLIIHKCVVCRKWEGGAFRPPGPPPLPSDRVLESPPFTCTGIDFLGPLMVKDTKEGERRMVKVWICLFTCAVTRALHLETVPDMSTENFLEALRRFISRRGKPSVIISDNARQFQLANNVIQKLWSNVIADPSVHSYIASNGITWKYIVPLAPWMGGFYERLVGLVKRSLRKVINGRLLSYHQLETFVIEAEGIINSRPLGFVGNDVENGQLLTPASFLGTAPSGMPPIQIDCEDPDFQQKVNSTDFLLSKWKLHQNTLEKFWKFFSDDYLLGLRERKMKLGTRNQVNHIPKINQVVLINDHGPRGQWKIGVIEKLSLGSDGGIRAVTIRLKGGKRIQRAIKLLHPLEVLDDQGIELQVPLAPSESSGVLAEGPERIRPVRLAAVKARTLLRHLFGRECRQRE